MGAVVLHRHDMDDRLLTAAKAADRRCQNELPAAHEGRRSPLNHHLLRLRTGADELRIDHPRPRHPPMEPRRINADARRSRDPSPRRHQPHRADQEALGRHDLIKAGQPHQRRQQHRQTDGERAVDDPVGGDVGKALRGTLLQRSHDDGAAPLGMRLDEHRVDQIVVELGMLPLDRPGGVDEIHPVTDQRQEPAHGRAGQRQPSGRQPPPPHPPGQSTGNDPMFGQNPERQPNGRRHRRGEEEVRQRHPLEIGPGRFEATNEIPIGVGLFLVGSPAADDERLGAVGRHAGHDTVPSRLFARRSLKPRGSPAGSS